MNSKTNNYNIPCPKCKNIFNIIKAGSRKTKNGVNQRYFCKDCNCKFTPKNYPDEAILYALKLSKQITYTYKGEIKLTLSEITKMVNKKFNLCINSVMISDWIKNYTPNMLSTSVKNKTHSKIKTTKIIDFDPDRMFKPYKINITSI